MLSLRKVKVSASLLKISLVSGIIGSLIMFMGNVLMFKSFFYISGSEMLQTYFDKLASVDKLSLFAGSYLGIVSLPFYIFGFYHVFLLFKKHSLFIAIALFLIFVFSISFDAAYHNTFASQANASYLHKLFADNSIIEASVRQTIRFSFYLFKISDTGFKLATAIFILAGLIFKHNFGKLYFILSPLLLLYFTIPILSIIPAPIGGIITGGYSNIVFFLHFLVSFIILRKINLYDKGSKAY